MIEYLSLIIGLALLYKGADWLVEGASALAKRLGISALVIGLTIVAFGTSMPELIVNIFASIQGKADVSFGNIIGSNIFNILFILGIAGLLTPLTVQKSTVRKEIPLGMVAVIVLFIMSNKALFNSNFQNTLTKTDGIILLLFFALFLLYIFNLLKHSAKNETLDIKKYSSLKLFFLITGGLIALFIGGKFTVDGAVSIARQLGVSELLISATIIAGGTSLPELVTSIVAAIRKEMDISVGNIVGSNIFNIFFIMGISVVIAPLPAPLGINMDFLVLGITTLLLYLFMYSGKRHTLDRWEAAIFLLLYAAYTTLVIYRG
ncbi:MAG TPA: calcium/sodium antiporter [Candidatus Nanoarchaeia archaeon]|nr:calcium/sodium antiporter [Candidatus Nanoarchaeia archaeon]